MNQPTPKLRPQKSYWQPNPKEDRKAVLLFFLISIVLAVAWWLKQ